MEMFLGDGWEVQPAGGATGEAYVARHGDQQVFLKRNSSPFLAVLSAEGIVPKLLWTKRLENGDVITAQRWVKGQELKAHQMKDSQVASLLSTIHGSSELLDMFKRIGNEPLIPEVMLENLHIQTELAGLTTKIIKAGMEFLGQEIHKVKDFPSVVCHCDINHNNWIIDDATDNLYLIDWDGAMVADPALDIGLLLYSYIAEQDWAEWLDHYGITLDRSLRDRMHWYVVAQTITLITWHYERGQPEEAAKFQDYLITLL
ncbi:phosphotransferase family protein [Alkalicoccobacillus porphyridii]|uniref:Phosphotransferase family protein n=1 Tax=Alkalicoccobacillus porphyridii TaxID=2597270 RepID=A0A554A4J2_9BACI|nr:phosphotransferase family protein [Alkalicoccobacillus porphyridii]TSB48607.1 phosphotransferase family protein [Alkalicoccobacillus porphyridii]